MEQLPPINTSTRSAISRLKPWLLAAAVMLCGLGATLFYNQYAHNIEKGAQASAFESEVARAASTIDQQLINFQLVIRGLQGFFQSSTEVTYEEFRHYVASLDLDNNLDGVLAIAYAVPLHRSQLDEHEKRLNKDLPVAYRVWPDDGAAELAPLIYMEPLNDVNLKALGFNIFSNPVARLAAINARDSGDIVITPPMNLVQDQGQQERASFVLYFPVYESGKALASVEDRRQALLGWVDVPFRMEDFIEGLSDQLDNSIDIEIYDTSEGNNRLLYHSDQVPATQRRAAEELQLSRDINVGSRTWQIIFSTTPAYRANLDLPSRGSLVVLSGVILSFMLSLLVFFIARARERSERGAVRISHLYHALSEINQAIVRMDTDKELFPLVCKLAVLYGDMRMAWIGRADDNGIVVPVASYGSGTEYISALDISANEGEARGQGPTGTVIRTGTPLIINDYLAEQRTTLWHDNARRFGWGSAAVFPIKRNGKTEAALKVYHYRKDAFDDRAVKLLSEMASDISFALDNFDREQQRKAFESELRESEAMLSTVMENVGAVIFVKDREGRYTFANQMTLDLLGVNRSEIIGQRDHAFFAPPVVDQILDSDMRVMEQGEVLSKEEVITFAKSGLSRTFWSVKIPLRDESGMVYGLCGISTDITELKASQSRVRYLSNYDLLTGLPNRTLLEDKLRVLLSAAQGAKTSVAVLYLNLDRFKNINESLGLGVGDALLKEIARRMTGKLTLNALLSRVSGDEFVVALGDTQAEEALHTARQLQGIISQPVTVLEHQVATSASIGIAIYPEHGDDVGALLQFADAALINAKQVGPGTIQIFKPGMTTRARADLQIENELRNALQKDQFELHYQPQLNIESGEITGVEALIRWHHPRIGTIPPSNFIHIAEQIGAIHEIGLWVLETAISQMIRWQQNGTEIPRVSVNLSILQLHRKDFHDKVASLLQKYQLSGDKLEFELTESIALEASGEAQGAVSRLHKTGIQFSIDDFGTGYSSLSYLKRLPIGKIKIDRSFIFDLERNPEDQAIVLAIIGIARGLGCTILAEGVEEQAQLHFLRDAGCHEYQGFLFSPAIPGPQIESLSGESD